MPHPPRIQYHGAIYHVTARGNGRQLIYLDDVDFNLYLHQLEVTVELMEWICHGYCLMDNHHHLIIETPEPNLSAGIQRLNGLYARKFNKRHGRSDHLFRARFRCREITRDGYLMEANRYTVRNPLAAGMCERPEDWPWSSFRATAGLAPVPRFLTLDRILGYFGEDKRRAQRRYIEFVNSAGAPRSLGDLEVRLELAADPKAA